jgi:hypothetical protein
MSSITRRFAPIMAVVALAGALLPSTASADSLTKRLLDRVTFIVEDAGRACADETLSKPFTPWLDVANYKLAPGGNFEADSLGWKLTGGAAVVDGNSPFQVGGPDDASSLRLPPGASATSPTTCVSLTYPTFRFFAGSEGAGKLDVDVVYERFDIDTGSVRTGEWAPSRLLFTGALTLGAKQMSIRLTNTGGTTVDVDDVYVDPFRRG